MNAETLKLALQERDLSPLDKSLELGQLEAGVESSTARTPDEKSELRALCREKCRGGPRLRTPGRRVQPQFSQGAVLGGTDGGAHESTGAQTHVTPFI